jgi:hypothetical protein
MFTIKSIQEKRRRCALWVRVSQHWARASKTAKLHFCSQNAGCCLVRACLVTPATHLKQQLVLQQPMCCKEAGYGKQLESRVKA